MRNVTRMIFNCYCKGDSARFRARQKTVFMGDRRQNPDDRVLKGQDLEGSKRTTRCVCNGGPYLYPSYQAVNDTCICNQQQWHEQNCRNNLPGSSVYESDNLSPWTMKLIIKYSNKTNLIDWVVNWPKHNQNQAKRGHLQTLKVYRHFTRFGWCWYFKSSSVNRVKFFSLFDSLMESFCQRNPKRGTMTDVVVTYAHQKHSRL